MAYGYNWYDWYTGIYTGDGDGGGGDGGDGGYYGGGGYYSPGGYYGWSGGSYGAGYGTSYGSGYTTYGYGYAGDTGNGTGIESPTNPDGVTPADEVGGNSSAGPSTQPKDTYLDTSIHQDDGETAKVTFNGKTLDDGLSGNQTVTQRLASTLDSILYFSTTINSINVSATTNGHVDEPNSDHVYGDAVDINYVNGAHIKDGGTAWAMADDLAAQAMDNPNVRYVEAPSGTWARNTPGGDWVQLPNNALQYTHVHISVFPVK